MVERQTSIDVQGLRCWVRVVGFDQVLFSETDPDETCRVGVLWGPSGCGKSSLLQAGLLPRLNKHVVPVYVEATREDTEVGLLKAIQKRFPVLSDSDLPKVFVELRDGDLLPQGGKLLFVLDQFEQRLHSHSSEPDLQLVAALRQCDGGRVQGLVTVRDDFSASLHRFMQQIEVPWQNGVNSAMADLFDKPDARRTILTTRDSGQVIQLQLAFQRHTNWGLGIAVESR